MIHFLKSITEKKESEDAGFYFLKSVTPDRKELWHRRESRFKKMIMSSMTDLFDA
jgi:hypothetical protein